MKGKLLCKKNKKKEKKLEIKIVLKSSAEIGMIPFPKPR